MRERAANIVPPRRVINSTYTVRDSVSATWPLWHQWVRIRTRVQNALQAIALSHGLRRGSSPWSQAGQHAVASLSLTRYTAERRTALQSLYRHLEKQIADLNRKIEELAWQRPQARRVMTHPGVGPITALATETFLGEPKRFWMEKRSPVMWD